MRGELERITEENQGIREVFEAHRGDVLEVHLDDPMLRLDLNTPEAYKAAFARWSTA